MSRKIFTAIWGAALAVFAASLVFIMGVSYNYFTGVQMKQLHAETALAAQGVSLCGKDYFTFDRRLPRHLDRRGRHGALRHRGGRLAHGKPSRARGDSSGAPERHGRGAPLLPHACRPPALRRAASAGRDGAPSLGRAARALVACARVCAADLPCGAARAWALVSARLAAHKKNRRAHQCH